MENTLSQIEPMAKVMAATAMSSAFDFCMERKYLQGISNGESVFCLTASATTLNESVWWIRIKQVGKPIDDSAENCFTAIQKILFSCFLPKELQLLFLIKGDGESTKMYLGVRAPGQSVPAKSTVRNLNEFLKGIWPGLQTELVNDSDDDICQFRKDIACDNLENIYSITGIPSMESQYKKVGCPICCTTMLR